MIGAAGKGIVRKLDAAENDCDEGGNPYSGKQTNAIIERRVKKGK